MKENILHDPEREAAPLTLFGVSPFPSFVIHLKAAELHNSRVLRSRTWGWMSGAFPLCSALHRIFPFGGQLIMGQGWCLTLYFFPEDFVSLVWGYPVGAPNRPVPAFAFLSSLM